jgi:hypothetical protein
MQHYRLPSGRSGTHIDRLTADCIVGRTDRFEQVARVRRLELDQCASVELHGDGVRGLIGGIAIIEMVPLVLRRALESFPITSIWHANVLPIRVAGFALNDQFPSRDLYLSGSHSISIDGYLIPVELLVNISSIAPAKMSDCNDPTATIVSPFPREGSRTFRYAPLSSGLELVRKSSASCDRDRGDDRHRPRERADQVHPRLDAPERVLERQIARAARCYPQAGARKGNKGVMANGQETGIETLRFVISRHSAPTAETVIDALEDACRSIRRSHRFLCPPVQPADLSP